MLVYNQL